MTTSSRHSNRAIGTGLGLATVILCCLAAYPYLKPGPHPDRSSLITATALEGAAIHFQIEYEKLPDVGSRVTTNSPQGLELLNILLGLENLQNMRGVKFLSVKEGKNRKNGLVYNSTIAPEGLFDPWGNPYTVELDTDGDEHLHFKMGAKTIDLKNRRVAVYSPGKDGKPGTSDDVTTW